MRTVLLVLAAGLVGGARPTRPTPRLDRLDIGRVPFRVGETLTYQAKVNFISAGSASMRVEDVEPVRGHPAYHTVFDVRGHLLFYHVDEHFESWVDTAALVSLRAVQNIQQGSKHEQRTYDFYPERRVYVRAGQEYPSVADPLDEGSFLYFMRSLDLEVGKTYQLDRYYHLDRNPVIIRVDRKEHVTVPAGEFDAIVVKPIINSRGLFAQESQAEVWFADDSARTLLRLKSKLPMGTLYLELKQAEVASRR